MDWLALLFEIADRADALALARFRQGDLRVDTKPDRTLVTEADLAIEEEARRITRGRAPELAVFGEEQGDEPDRGAGRLIIDPIDSTANFARGIPIFGTLLAVERERSVVAGLVTAPALGTRWVATAGGGAYRISSSGMAGSAGERRRIHVSGVRRLADAQVLHGSLSGAEVRQGRELPPGHRALLDASHRQRGFGDFYQHVLVCEGASELAIDPGVKPWDVAPLLLLAQEAGGRATALDGSASIYAGSLLTSNGHLHERALAILAGREPAPEAD